MNAPRKRGVPFLQLFIFLGSFFILSSCGGGGGGGGGTAAGGITYNGVTTQAPLTVSNANKIFSVIWNGGPSGSVSLSPAISKAASLEYFKDNGMMTLFKQLKARSVSDAAGFVVRSKNVRQAAPVNYTNNGSVSGTETVTGSIDPNTMTGSLTLIYVNYNNGDGYTYDGTITFNIVGFDMTYGLITDGTMSFTLWTIKSASGDVSLSGSMRIQESVQNNSDILTVNLDGRDNITNDAARFQNFVVTAHYDSILSPTSMSETYSGRVYVGAYGYVDISTTSPFVYSSYSQGNPDSGGPIILSGADNSKAALTPISTSYVKIEVDADGDGIYESKNAYAWNNLAGEPVALAPIANAGPDQSVNWGTLVTLDGGASADPLGYPLTYSWSLTAEPGSTAVLSSPSSPVTTFIPDLPGTYTVSLIVSNGTVSSTPDHIIVTASGTLPKSTKALTAFAVLGIRANIDESAKTISVAVPFGTSVTGLIATFSTTGASVTAGGIAQVSGSTANDFTSPVVYIVTAEDGSTSQYTVTITVLDANANYIFLQSDPGDFIGGGQKYLYTLSNATINLSSTGDYLSIHITGAQWWYGDFQVPNNLTELQPGSYSNLTRYPFNDPTLGGLSWYGDGRGCNTLTGQFVIQNVSYSSGTLTAIDMNFEQHCEGGTPALYGQIHWN